MKPPPTGWDSLPNNSEHSLEADLVRIKYYRNEVYGHSRNLEISDDQFLDLWGKISKALLRIARKLSLEKQSRLKCTIEKFLQDPLTPEEERYADELEQWYEKDIDNKKLVQELVQEVRVMKEEVGQYYWLLLVGYVKFYIKFSIFNFFILLMIKGVFLRS